MDLSVLKCEDDDEDIKLKTEIKNDQDSFPAPLCKYIKFEDESDGSSTNTEAMQPAEDRESVSMSQSEHKPQKINFIETKSKEPRYSCDVCDKKYMERGRFFQHVMSSHFEKSYCKVCEKTLKVKSVHSHVIKHNRIKHYSCPVCHKQIKSKNNYKKHILKSKHNKAKVNYVCNICDKQFTFKSAFIIHMRTHTGEKLYGCDICGNKFGEKTKLIVHMKIHFGKPYACDLCLYRSATKSNLRKHLQSHAHAKHYKCTICKKQYAAKFDLLQHMGRIHNKHPPGGLAKARYKKIEPGKTMYACCLCEKQYAKEFYYKRHMIGAHEISPYQIEMGELCSKIAIESNDESELKIDVGEYKLTKSYIPKILTTVKNIDTKDSTPKSPRFNGTLKVYTNQHNTKPKIKTPVHIASHLETAVKPRVIKNEMKELPNLQENINEFKISHDPLDFRTVESNISQRNLHDVVFTNHEKLRVYKPRHFKSKNE